MVYLQSWSYTFRVTHEDTRIYVGMVFEKYLVESYTVRPSYCIKSNINETRKVDKI